MADPFTVDTEQLDHIVSQLTNLAGFLTDHLEDLQRKVEAVRAGSWAGPAAAAYREAHDKWVTAATEFAAGLTEMSAAAGAANTGYQAAADTNGTMLRGGSSG